MSEHGQLITIGVLGMALAAPVVWAALGELIAEQSGIINPGIEGVMLGAALVATLAYHHTRSLLLATAITVVFGLLVGLLLAYLYVSRGANQIITGILFNLLAIGATTAVFVREEYLARSRVPVTGEVPIPVLEHIPVLGPILFQQNLFVYCSYACMIGVFFLMRRTWLGLSMRAAGESPQTVEAAGIDVWAVRYVAVIAGSVLAAVGGAALVLAIVGGFNAGMTAGQGFIALGVVVLARWNAFATCAGALLFGLAQALQFEAQNISFLQGVPTELLLATPYLVTIAAVMLARGSEYPKAAGAAYLPLPGRIRGWLLERRSRWRSPRTALRGDAV